MSKAVRGGPSEERGFRTIDMLKSQPFFMINEFDEFSPAGVIGMPDLATSEKGGRFLEAASQSVVRFLDEFARWDFQTRPQP
jgi:creatinine amidohydrolase/Fe(II)-dependent formamide hydrolase-like protein